VQTTDWPDDTVAPADRTAAVAPAPSASPRWHGRAWRRRRLGTLGVVFAAFAVVGLAASSFTAFVTTPNGDTLQQRAVTWLRDHGLGGVVDAIERRVYADPPSTRPAEELGLAGAAADAEATALPTVLATTTAPVTTAPVTTAPVTTAPAATAPAVPAAAATAPATTAPAVPAVPVAPPPADLPPAVGPALAGEGVWVPIAAAGGRPAVWATSWRPSSAFPSVVGSFAVLDQTALRAALFNGSDVPGGTGWRRGNRVPEELRPAMVAAFNGGFRFEHIKGGYMSEGRVVRPLRDGDATLAIGRDGTVVIGELGRDLADDGSWVSLRQNLPLLVDAGKPMVRDRRGVWWGADYGNEMYVLRSSVCTLADGRLMYGAIGRVDAVMLADILAAMGCVRAMQLDINGTWPTFFTFSRTPAGTYTGNLLDRRMGGDPDRYLTGSSREFVAFFDRAALPATGPLE
jgi:hypothetical protein